VVNRMVYSELFLGHVGGEIAVAVW